MIHIAGVWRTTAPPDDVWTVVEDLETWPQWWPAIREVAPKRGNAGARVTFDTPSPMRPMIVELTVVEREPPTRLVVRATDGPLTGEATLSLEEDRSGTAVSFDVGMRVRALLFRPIESVLASASRAGGKDRLRQAGDDLAALAGGEPREHDV